MALSSLQAAKYICEKSGWTVSNLALHKILYIACMVHIGRTGNPLIRGQFEAWDYGPVQTTVYHRVKAFGSGPIKNVFHGISDAEGAEAETLEEACEALLEERPARLVAITHITDGAWTKRYKEGGRSAVISNADMLEEYNVRWPNEPR